MSLQINITIHDKRTKTSNSKNLKKEFGVFELQKIAANNMLGKIMKINLNEDNDNKFMTNFSICSKPMCLLPFHYRTI